MIRAEDWPEIRRLLASRTRMPSPAIAQRIDWPRSDGPSKKRLATIRPEWTARVPQVTTLEDATYIPFDQDAANLVFQLIASATSGPR